MMQYKHTIEIKIYSDCVGLKDFVFKKTINPIPVFIKPPNISDNVKTGYPRILSPPYIKQSWKWVLIVA